MKQYIEVFSDIYKDYIKDLESGSNTLSENLDKIIVWIIGLSTGSIALIFASTGKIDFIKQDTINVTLLFLLLSIVFGVVGRGISGISSYIGYHLNSQFKFKLCLLDFPYNERKLEGNEVAEIIYEYIKNDFKTDFTFILENKKLLKNEEINKYDEQIRKFYIDFIKLKKQENESAIKSINEIMISSFGLKKNFFEKYKIERNRTKGIIMRFCTNGSLVLYGFSMLSFLIAIIYVSIHYYCR